MEARRLVLHVPPKLIGDTTNEAPLVKIQNSLLIFGVAFLEETLTKALPKIKWDLDTLGTTTTKDDLHVRLEHYDAKWHLTICETGDM